MLDNHQTVISTEKATVLYELLLLFYPEPYRKRFGQEMVLVFEDLYQEELTKHKNIGVKFCLMLSIDALRGAIMQHIDYMKKQGMIDYMRNILHINRYNVMGAILLIPLVTMMTVDFVGRVIQGDLFHYNRPLYAVVSRTPLYWVPVLFTWVFLFPSLAALINLIPLIKQIARKGTFSIGNTLLVGLGISFVFIMVAHDFLPCMIFGLLSKGFGQFLNLLAVCKNA